MKRYSQFAIILAALIFVPYSFLRFQKQESGSFSPLPLVHSPERIRFKNSLAGNPLALTFQKVAVNLSHPVYLTHDGTKRLFVVEQPGQIRILQEGKLLERPYLEIEGRVDYGGEKGLLSVAFHPEFRKNGLFYVNYTSDQQGLVTIISEFRASPDASVANPETERILLKIDQPYSNHNGGQIKFGPDGFLYIGMGDGGSAGDPQNHAQNPKSLLGKMLRIDVNHQKPYAIPADNPFVQDSTYRPEIWATGLRNPWRFSFDRLTGDLYAADVGQNKYEEIHIIVSGGNYGWRIKEGFHPFKAEEQAGKKLIDPIKEYDRSWGNSITGGYVYRGKAIPELQGWYLYGDYGSGRIGALKWSQGKIQDEDQLGTTGFQISSFGEDAEGELYVCNHDGEIYKIISSAKGTN